MWGKVSCLRKQHDGRNWASNHRPSDLKFNALTTIVHLTPQANCQIVRLYSKTVSGSLSLFNELDTTCGKLLPLAMKRAFK